MTDMNCIQESAGLKSEWLEQVEKLFPIGCRVRVTDADWDGYIGAFGTVRGYDLGCHGEYPLISVTLDVPVGKTSHDGFCDDELERLP